MDEFRHLGGRKAVTLQEVAKAAGVSPSAASIILNGARGGTRVSVSTRRTVFETATRLGYRPNQLARSLATGRSNRVGVYSGKSRLDCRNPFYAELIGGVLEGADQFGLDTVVHTPCRDEGRLIDLVKGHSLDGLVVHAYPDDPILPLLSELLVPKVIIADHIDGLPSVTVDDRAGGILLAQHLANRGHRHVLVKQAPFPPRSAVVRTSALAETFVRLGGKVSWGVEAIDDHGRLDIDDLRLLTEEPDRATAVMGWSDQVAEQICHSLESLGMAIPDKVAVVGFDGFHKPYAPRFDLTTIMAPWASVGREAVRHLTTLIQGGTIPLFTTLPVAFHHGRTT